MGVPSTVHHQFYPCLALEVVEVVETAGWLMWSSTVATEKECLRAKAGSARGRAARSRSSNQEDVHVGEGAQ
jgi:hypothetical protein